METLWVSERYAGGVDNKAGVLHLNLTLVPHQLVKDLHSEIGEVTKDLCHLSPAHTTPSINYDFTTRT